MENKVAVMARLAKCHKELYNNSEFISVNSYGDVHLSNDGFKELFAAYKVEPLDEETNYLKAIAYGVTFFCLDKEV